MLSLVRSNWIFRWGLAALLVLFVSACGDEAGECVDELACLVEIGFVLGIV